MSTLWITRARIAFAEPSKALSAILRNSLFTNSHSEYAQAVLQKSCVCTQARECNCIAFTIPDHIEDSRDRGKARNKREDGEPTDMRKPQYALLLLSSQPPLSSEPTKYACATTILPITLFVFDTWDYMRAFKIESDSYACACAYIRNTIVLLKRHCSRNFSDGRGSSFL